MHTPSHFISMVISLILSYFVAVQGLPLVAAQRQEDTQNGLARRMSLESSPPTNTPPSVSAQARPSTTVNVATRTTNGLITVTFVAGNRDGRVRQPPPTVIVGIPQSIPRPQSSTAPAPPAQSVPSPAPPQTTTTSSSATISQEANQPTPTVKPAEPQPSQPTTQPEVRPPNLPPTESRANEGGVPVVGEKSTEGASKEGESKEGATKEGEKKEGESKPGAEAGALGEGEKGEAGKEAEKKEEPNNIVFNVAGAGGFAAIVAAGIGFMKYRSRREKLTQT
ncbi:uncharacterized protein SPPG_06683 [Spizellomyces punctatus DAOM BR117]|uniref:Mid2 domain-containing protein n=1 Tax=Spizellomyces punctatus (strain DAOM BR117) TaxID=645134 RepID=A0A0L0HBG9_SPIPD|nr:uncharacterized protein SPPG_06683 [Spizellomyces punctatus DAOM BR117]KNC98286.1 hypothetical protein SPPG_06683 [Spizellomyces punctatus DAOM BR117]|eukprot:XP_016606326.1 hypothetical protein SPPG_06683 [Spizellomyces punctatus DAOM BR117]